MKKVLLAGIAIILAVASTFAQAKKDNVILVSGVDLNTAIIKCLDMGYNISSKDQGLNYAIVTTVDRHSNAISLTLRVKDSVLMITGKGDMQMEVTVGMFSGKTAAFRIEYSGMKGSSIRQSWEVMDDLAKSFGQPIQYNRL